MPLTCWSNSSNPDTVTYEKVEIQKIKYVCIITNLKAMH